MRSDNTVFPFEDVGDSLNLLPLSARRALDIAGFRLSLEGFQSLSYGDRLELSAAGAEDAVDVAQVERLVRKSATPPTRIKPVPEPDPLIVPDQLNAALGARRAVDNGTWSHLRALERYALLHVMRRSIAHDDPARLEAAADHIVPRRRSERPRASAAPRAAYEGHDDLHAGGHEPPAPSFDRHSPSPYDVLARPASQPPPSMPAVLAPSRAPQAGALEVQRSSQRPPAYAPAAVRQAADRVADRRSEPPASRRSDPPRGRSEPPVSTHLGQSGDVRMVNVGAKDVTARRATAFGQVHMRPETAHRLARNEAPKGEVLATARVAGILAAKRTHELIPLCHAVHVTSIEVLLDVDAPAGVVNVTAVVEAADRTGVEMEALTAVSVACLTIYDMLKGVDRDMTIEAIKLLAKQGGKTGFYVRNQG